MLNTAYALPYALAQPFLGPIGDRFGKTRCIQVCVAGLAATLLLGALAPSFALLLATRVAAGIFAGGLIPLVLAGIGDRFDMRERQVMIGRMLFAIISGQMLGSVVSGFANDAFGWHSALAIGAAVGAVASAVAWGAMPRGANATTRRDDGSFADLYARVLANPKAPWLIGGVAVEGAFFYGLFPYMGELLRATAVPGSGSIARITGIVLGAFGVGGLLYAASAFGSGDDSTPATRPIQVASGSTPKSFGFSALVPARMAAKRAALPDPAALVTVLAETRSGAIGAGTGATSANRACDYRGARPAAPAPTRRSITRVTTVRPRTTMTIATATSAARGPRPCSSAAKIGGPRPWPMKKPHAKRATAEPRAVGASSVASVCIELCSM